MVRGSCRQKLAISCCRESRENFCRCVSKEGKIGWCKVKIGAKFFSIQNLAKSTIRGIYVMYFSTDPPPGEGGVVAQKNPIRGHMGII